MKVAYSEYWTICFCIFCFVVWWMMMMIMWLMLLLLIWLCLVGRLGFVLLFLIHTVKRLHLVFCSVVFLHIYSIFHYNIFLSLLYRFGEIQIHLDSMYCANFIFIFFIFCFLIFLSLDNFFFKFFLLSALYLISTFKLRLNSSFNFSNSKKKKRMVKCLMIIEGKNYYWQMIEIIWKIIKKKKKMFPQLNLKNLVRKKQFLVKLESAIFVKETTRFFQEHTFCFLFCL